MFPGLHSKRILVLFFTVFLLALSVKCEDATVTSKVLGDDLNQQDYLMANNVDGKSPWSDYAPAAEDIGLRYRSMSMPSLRYGYPASVAGYYQLPYRQIDSLEDSYPVELFKSKRNEPDAKGKYRLRFGRSGVRLRYGRSDPSVSRFG